MPPFRGGIDVPHKYLSTAKIDIISGTSKSFRGKMNNSYTEGTIPLVYALAFPLFITYFRGMKH